MYAFQPVTQLSTGTGYYLPTPPRLYVQNEIISDNLTYPRY